MNRNFHRNQNKYVAHLDMMFFETGKLFIFNLRKLDLLQKKPGLFGYAIMKRFIDKYCKNVLSS